MRTPSSPGGGVDLVLADAHDPLAAAVAGGLRRRGRDVVITSATALLASAVTYRTCAGHVSWRAELQGFVVESERVGSVFNRTRTLAPVGFDDRDDELYAISERAALFAAMVESIDGPVVNRSNGASLAGPPAFPLHWLLRAARCGLPVRPTRLSAAGIHRTDRYRALGVATVVGGRVSGVFDPAWRSSLVSLARALDCHLLQVGVGTGADGWCVDRVDPFPDALDAVALGWLLDDLAGPARSASVEREVA